MNEKDTDKAKKMNRNLGEKIIDFLEKKWFGIGLIVLISTIIYYNSLNIPFIFDDMHAIVENPDIKNLSNIKTKLIYPYNIKHKVSRRNDPSRPLTYLTFTLNYHFGKLNPFGYHVFNILIHIFNAILIFFLTRKIIFYVCKKYSNLFPLFVALFFAVHPINSVVVINICHRSTSLATFFYLLSLLFFIKTFEKNRIFYIFSFLSFILSFFSKQTAATLPLMVLIVDFMFLSDFKIKKVIQKRYYHMPLWFILIGFLLFRHLYFGSIGLAMADPYIKWSTYSYFITQFYVIVKYFKLLFIPIGLCIDHLVYPAKAIFEPKIIFSFFIIIGIFILVYKISRKKTNISKIVLFSTLWFFITLSPSSSFFPLISAMADRRAYLSGFGFYLVIISVYFMIFCKDFFCTNSSIRKRVLLSVIGIHILLLSVATVRRNMLFQNPVLLWQDVILRYPHNVKAHNSLGILYKELGEYDKALQEYQKAIELNPDYAITYNNLGVLYHIQKDHNKAFLSYQKAIEFNPDYSEAHSNLGLVYHRQKKYNKAFDEYQMAIQLELGNVKAHNNLGLLYYELGEYNKAKQEFEEAIKIDQNDIAAHNNLGVLYYKQKEYKKALHEFELLSRLNPDDRYAKDMIKTLRRLLKERSST